MSPSETEATGRLISAARAVAGVLRRRRTAELPAAALLDEVADRAEFAMRAGSIAPRVPRDAVPGVADSSTQETKHV